MSLSHDNVYIQVLYYSTAQTTITLSSRYISASLSHALVCVLYTLCSTAPARVARASGVVCFLSPSAAATALKLFGAGSVSLLQQQQAPVCSSLRVSVEAAYVRCDLGASNGRRRERERESVGVPTFINLYCSAPELSYFRTAVIATGLVAHFPIQRDFALLFQ